MSEKKSEKGRPSKYYPKYCEEIIGFFSGERNREVEIITTGKNDYQKIETKLIPNPLPTLERFAHSINVNGDTLVEWAKVHKEFSAAYIRAKELQKDFLIENGTMGLFNPQFTIFVAKNVTDMRDKTETDLTSKGEKIEMNSIVFTNFKDDTEGK